MNTYVIDGTECTSIELKRLLVSCGLNVDKDVCKTFKPIAQLNESPLCCNCLRLSDGTIVQLIPLL